MVKNDSTALFPPLHRISKIWCCSRDFCNPALWPSCKIKIPKETWNARGKKKTEIANFIKILRKYSLFHAGSLGWKDRPYSTPSSFQDCMQPIISCTDCRADKAKKRALITHFSHFSLLYILFHTHPSLYQNT